MKLRKYVLVVLVISIVTYSFKEMAISEEIYHNLDNVMFMYCMKEQPSNIKNGVEARISEPLYIPGDYLKAAMVAGQSFQENINRKWKNNPSPVSIYLLNISNYSIVINRDTKDGQYKIEFSPKPFQDSPIKGGGATYVIDSKSFKILKKDYSM